MLSPATSARLATVCRKLCVRADPSVFVGRRCPWRSTCHANSISASSTSSRRMSDHVSPRSSDTGRLRYVGVRSARQGARSATLARRCRQSHGSEKPPRECLHRACRGHCPWRSDASVVLVISDLERFRAGFRLDGPGAVLAKAGCGGVAVFEELKVAHLAVDDL